MAILIVTVLVSYVGMVYGPIGAFLLSLFLMPETRTRSSVGLQAR